MDKSTWNETYKHDFHSNLYDLYVDLITKEKMISIKRPIITFFVNNSEELLLKYAVAINTNYINSNGSCIICNNTCNITISAQENELNICDKCYILILEYKNNFDEYKISTSEHVIDEFACNCKDEYVYIKKIKDMTINKLVIDGVVIYCKNMYFLRRKNIRLRDFPYSKVILPSYHNICMICEMTQAIYTYDNTPCCYNCVQYSITAVIEQNYIKLLMIDEIIYQNLIQDLLMYTHRIYGSLF